MATTINGFHDYDSLYARTLRERTHVIGEKRAKKLLGMPAAYYMERLEYFNSLAKPSDLQLQQHYLCGVEIHWYTHARPYYRVFPDYANMFAATAIDIPVTRVRMPYPVFAVLFKQNEGPIYDDVQVESAMLCYEDEKGTEWCRKHFGQPYLKNTVWLGVAGRNLKTGQRLATDLSFRWDTSSTETVAEMLNEATAAHLPAIGVVSESSESKTKQVLNDIMRVVLVTGFLATGGDQLIEHDLLTPDLEAYMQAVNAGDKKTPVVLAAKAQRTRNGRPGFTVGRREWLLGRQRNGGGDTTGTGVPITRAYLRRGCLRLYHVGPGRKETEVLWVRPHMVRPDLPLPAGYRPGEHSLDSTDTQDRINEGG